MDIQAPQTYGRQSHAEILKEHVLLCRHEEYAEHLADARETTRIDLADIYRLRLEQLLEHHPIVRMLARRHADRMFLERASDRSVPQYIIWRRRLLDKPKVTFTLRRN